jgi:hypothetical protein
MTIDEQSWTDRYGPRSRPFAWPPPRPPRAPGGRSSSRPAAPSVSSPPGLQEQTDEHTMQVLVLQKTRVWMIILFPRKPVDPVMSTLLFLKYSVIFPSSNAPTILLGLCVGICVFVYELPWTRKKGGRRRQRCLVCVTQRRLLHPVLIHKPTGQGNRGRLHKSPRHVITSNLSTQHVCFPTITTR